MEIRWYGQSAFLLTGEQSVFIDPFGDMSGAASRGMQFDYPAIEANAEVVVVTHEHVDHNGVEAVGGDPAVVRSTAGKHDSPAGPVTLVASEHDRAAGTERGPNTIACFTLDGLRVCHLGDLGQGELRPEQIEAIGEVDVLFIPAGAGPTIGGEEAAAVVRRLRPRLVVPMHYRTEALNFLDPPDEFLDALGATVERLEASSVVAKDVLGTPEEPVVALLAPPLGP
jgi:L-ascorbate metabolism protein UlaG (beta-lactamase superfamily)